MVKLRTASGPLRGMVTPPPSKSITHRALVAAALCRGPTRIDNPLEAEDTRLTRTALVALGVPIVDESGAWQVAGGLGHAAPGPGAEGELTLHLGNSGTSLRLLLPLAALGNRQVIVDGDPRLRQRPVGPQAGALARLGAAVDYLGTPDCPPLRVRGPLQPGRVDLDASASSQFLSGLLMAAAALPGPLTVRVEALSSRPYVNLTCAVLSAFGTTVQMDAGLFTAGGGGLVSPGTFRVEADASAAAFLLAAGVVTGGQVRVEGVGLDSAQGDVAFLDLLQQMGCEVAAGSGWMSASGRPARGLQADLNGTPDLVPPAVAVALLAPGPSRLTGIGHLRHKESDRLAALAGEAARLGGRVQEGADFLAIEPAPLTGAGVSAHGDHRIAMAMALVGLCVPGMELDDPACVAKSYPDFFTDLDALHGGAEPVG